jgi:hypothetical protein
VGASLYRIVLKKGWKARLLMYDTSMKSGTYPLAMPPDLLGEMRKAAKRTNLSIADTMRQSMRLGLSKLLEQLSDNQIKPLTAEECRMSYQTPNPEFDALEHHCASLPKSLLWNESLGNLELSTHWMA